MSKQAEAVSKQNEAKAEEAKRVAPYPFFVELRAAEVTIKANALKLVMHGLMIELKTGVVKVGNKFNLLLELPAGLGKFETEVNIVRTIDRKVPSKSGSRTQRIIEVHFAKPLVDKNKQLVKRFLKEINQVGNDTA
ncbi:MAG: hypothetical protein HRT45_07930 [Bdellovibrionales bacterium]|nr:hypothetical protein [Bdellovibrionales bacterium]